ncbi:MAG: hypothetical protein ABIK44_01390 [candidate division WOR-3 bacterium]
MSIVFVLLGIVLVQRGHIASIRAELIKTRQSLIAQREGLTRQVRDTTGRMPYLFRVYGSDEGALHEEVNFYLAIPESLSLREKLEFLIARVSKYRFRGLPLRLVRLDDRQGKKIAVIDLEEPEFREGLSWGGSYFQGTTGGHFTYVSLVKTFLQNDYPGEWIDGVQFLYRGKPFEENDWDHINLSGTFYRHQERE